MSNPNSSQQSTATTTATTVPEGEKQHHHHHHWWQDIPRRLSFTRARSNSESRDISPTSSPSAPAQTETKQIRSRRFSEASASSFEKTADIRERWNKNYNIPPECFVPPWI